MNTTQIAERLSPFLSTPNPDRVPRQSSAWTGLTLTPAQLDQISTYIDLLIRWNARVNLTAIRNPDEIVTRHFGESLFAARHLLPRGPDAPWGADTPVRVSPITGPASRAEADHGSQPSLTAGLLVDFGSGAGFPGIPIKIWSPRTRVTLIESNHKKVAFLREVIRALTLIDIDVFAGRAADFPPASASLLTLRAVERFASILPTACGLLTPGGALALLIAQAQLAQAQSLAPSLLWDRATAIPQSEHRVLLVGEKSR